MKRYNIFYQVHKGLRAMLYETAILLQQTDFSNEEETNTIAECISEVVVLFDKHAHSEDSNILNTIESFEPSVAGLFAAEHVKDHELSNRLTALVNMLHAATLDQEKEQLGSALRVAFTEFVAFNLEHMAKEERELNRLLWDNFSDEELHGITMQIISQIPVDLLNAFNFWMMRGLSNNEIIHWLKQIKNTAPDAVFNGMMQLAETELSQQRFSIVTESLTEGAMLA
ncbi:MAG: hemerythrin domain-containing protein [Ferruginibacter sp.]|nr:hemerythrin domain-containing protein [Ferruginibacter sp.]MBU9935947.1 hemerythrin domain-containing protein [Ferruginibacter sp.]